MCVDGVSDGKRARSRTQTFSPRRTSMVANGDPAHRAPTITTSKDCIALSSAELDQPAVFLLLPHNSLIFLNSWVGSPEQPSTRAPYRSTPQRQTRQEPAMT